MAYAEAFHMPGNFYTDGNRTGLFRPPISPAGSPASSGYLPSRSTPTTALSDASAKRKRVNTGVRSREADLADATQPFFTMPSPHRFQVEPVTNGADYGMGESMLSDGDYRHMLGTKRTRDDAAFRMDPNESIFALQPPADEISGPSKGWASVAYTTIGGVVGKVWDFCTAGAFRGFHAGGGQGYDAQGIVDEVPNMQWDRAEEKMGNSYSYGRTLADSDELVIRSRSSTPTAPAPKRRQTGATTELGKNWVMVDKSEERLQRPATSTSSYRPSPRNRNSGPSLATGRRISTPASRRTPNGRMSSFHTPSTAPARPASSASFAAARTAEPSPCASHIPVASSYASPTPARSSTHRSRSSLSAAPSYRQTHSRSHSSVSASTAAARTSGSRSQETADPSPRLDAEAKKLASRRQKENRETDARMNDFNKRLQDMIRQGQQALGTRIEIDGDGDGEGWEDD